MERRMVSMNWDQLDDLDDDDEFYESTNRISAVVPLDFDYNEEDDQELDDSRVSFSNNVSNRKSFKDIQNVTVAAAPSSSSSFQYDMWMMAPGSITDRRRKLLQGMGLNSNKDFARISTTKLNKAMTKRVASRLPDATSSLDVNIANQNPISGTSMLLLSSSMDKTVRLWDIETKNCLKQFAHRDYVTCIQFNPTDDDYFISGSLDTKVRLWSIPGRKVIDWSDLHDMITSVSYSPDGQGAIVGLHKGSCKSYSTIDCKLEEKDQLQLHSKPKAEPKKITGFQFSPFNPTEVLVTSADSRIRILDGSHVVNKLIGYKNTTSQFSAQYSADGRYIICASEDSQVYIWKHERPKHTGAAKTKFVTTTSYEHFPCTEVTVVQPWLGSSKFQRINNETQSKGHSKRSDPLAPTPERKAHAKKPSELPPIPKKSTEKTTNPVVEDSEQPSDASVAASESADASSQSESGHHSNGSNVQSTAWGLVIVTAGAGGEIRVYQNVGLPVKVGLQTNLF
ncbi:hypothetical protein L6452_42099 [Arctium lappa]|uniref:Uncharacterized protein n=1 Tax=Arctium lappa TaxID=4217 RepID=A0ACB8XHX7_ARCLA|nr:hypothetical protein L6452_42099 [Arctium lappa]